MSFLDSEYVRASLVDIHELQEDIYKDVMRFPHMTDTEKYEHISKLEELLEKQKIMYTRVALSDDPEAIQIKENIVDAAKMLGVPGEVDPGTLFDSMYQTITRLKGMLEETLDD
ncbi:DUF1825 domain-containing protein [Synechococcus phage S-CAM9]|uniref:DUF1825 domain-containing protein n=1 Tax=Synechococcus phage S-CAM9 TaxID=1883369 RepID=A0A1D8KQE8_9CAUD|nr:DUF1825 domain-containing protein [Synechococcus phage S-CAM9]AOV60375.1 DUF1825 domain-containing protein [Synechococcus phage S-CAM9]AOV60603.1 DUF1825 domain-containing protein [Synechococcus phage S-CAM9]AOV60832.1 DUF1825 domain-containing protein [Synechococcus phage S-CAM9]